MNDYMIFRSNMTLSFLPEYVRSVRGWRNVEREVDRLNNKDSEWCYSFVQGSGYEAFEEIVA
jgi:hypothetical protein